MHDLRDTHHSQTVVRHMKAEPIMKILLLTLLTICSVSCNSQEKKNDTVEIEKQTEPEKGEQIGQYVVETFEDSKGNLWFGTLEKGVAKYDRKQVDLFVRLFLVQFAFRFRQYHFSFLVNYKKQNK